MTVLLLEDKLGITQGYMPAWESLLLGAGLLPSNVKRASLWRSAFVGKYPLLTRKGNRKSPGFNPELTDRLREWTRSCIRQYGARLVLCMDVALLGLVEDGWDIATIDNLRGGVYDFDGIPFIIMPPISAIHTQKKPKDLRAMNDGAENEDEFSADDEFDIFIEPYTIPYGERILSFDLRKAYRIYQQVNNK